MVVVTQAKTSQTCCKIVKFNGLVASCQKVATNWSISSSCNKSVKIKPVATCLLHLLQLVETTCGKSIDNKFFDNQLATSLLTTCNRLVVDTLLQAMRMHPDIGLL